jgi:hypothetical protein
MLAYGQSNRAVPLDTAIMVAAERIDSRIAAGTKIALLNFNSATSGKFLTPDKFSEYVLDELEGYLDESGLLNIVDRKEINLRRGELNFQISGEVSDDSMQSLGRTLGAQSIVSGSLTEIDDTYRFVIRVLNVESGSVEARYQTNIENDSRVKSLLGITRPTIDKVGTGAMNIVFGLGSYLEGDIFGGITVSAGYALAIGLMVIEATALDWDSPAVGVPATLGVITAGLTAAYGFARPFIYNHSPQIASITDNAQLRITQVPGAYTGDMALGLQLSYSIRF